MTWSSNPSAAMISMQHWYTQITLSGAVSYDCRRGRCSYVSDLLGHSQVSTTLDIYTHAFDDKKKAASAVLQESLDI